MASSKGSVILSGRGVVEAEVAMGKGRQGIAEEVMLQLILEK